MARTANGKDTATADGYREWAARGYRYDPEPDRSPSPALLEALVGFADSNRDLFAAYVAGWHDNAAAILAEWQGTPR